MSEKGYRTAEDLMRELQSDPEYCARMAEKDARYRRREAKYAALEAPMFAELHGKGYPCATLQDLMLKYAPLDETITGILLRWLQKQDEPRVQEMLARALGASGVPFDASPLIRCFEATFDEGVRDAVLNTIALAKPTGTEAWLEQLAAREPGRRKFMKALGIWPDEQGPQGA